LKLLFDRKKLAKDISASGLKKNFIVDKANIHRSYLHKILSGEREPSYEVLKKIYKALWNID
jgi:predicted transcriptional regulator